MLRGKAVVFDCDGLLLDTEKLWTKGEEALFAAYGQPHTAEHERRMLGVSGAAAGKILAEVLDQPGREKELIAELKDLCWNEVVEGARPMPGAVDLVAELHGTVPLGVASNSPAALVKEALGKTGLEDAFDEVLGEEAVTKPKPDPDIYLLACDRLGADPFASLALEDSRPGMAAARAAGMYVVGVPSQPGTDLDADTVADSLSHPSVRVAIARVLSGPPDGEPAVGSGRESPDR